MYLHNIIIGPWLPILRNLQTFIPPVLVVMLASVTSAFVLVVVLSTVATVVSFLSEFVSEAPALEVTVVTVVAWLVEDASGT